MTCKTPQRVDEVAVKAGHPVCVRGSVCVCVVGSDIVQISIKAGQQSSSEAGQPVVIETPQRGGKISIEDAEIVQLIWCRGHYIPLLVVFPSLQVLLIALSVQKQVP